MKKLITLTLIIFCNILFAQNIPSPWKFYNDYTGKHSSNEVEWLLESVYHDDSILCAVLIVDKLDNSIEEYAMNIGNNWKLYKEDRDAIVIVIYPDGRKSTVQPSSSLSPILTSGVCGENLRTVRPYFKNNDIAGGVQQLVKNLRTKVKSEKSKGNTPVTVKEYKSSNPFDPISFFGWLFGIIAIIAGAVYYFNEKSKLEATKADEERMNAERIQKEKYDAWLASPAGKEHIKKQNIQKAEQELKRHLEKKEREEKEKERLRWLATPEGKVWAENEKLRLQKEALALQERLRKTQTERRNSTSDNNMSGNYSIAASTIISSNSTSDNNNGISFDPGSSAGFDGGGAVDSW